MMHIWAPILCFFMVSLMGKLDGQENRELNDLIQWKTHSGVQGAIDAPTVSKLKSFYSTRPKTLEKDIGAIDIDMSSYCSAEISKENIKRSKLKNTPADGRPQLSIHFEVDYQSFLDNNSDCLLYTSPSPRD